MIRSTAGKVASKVANRILTSRRIATKLQPGVYFSNARSPFATLFKNALCNFVAFSWEAQNLFCNLTNYTVCVV